MKTIIALVKIISFGVGLLAILGLLFWLDRVRFVF